MVMDQEASDCGDGPDSERTWSFKDRPKSEARGFSALRGCFSTSIYFIFQ